MAGLSLRRKKNIYASRIHYYYYVAFLGESRLLGSESARQASASYVAKPGESRARFNTHSVVHTTRGEGLSA